MKQTAFLSICLIGILSQPALAVDGYKGVKFGASEDEFLSKRICSMTYEEEFAQDSRVYQCNDFKLGGIKTSAYAYFIDGKFLRLAIPLEWESMVSVGQGLANKYGLASSGSSKEELAAVDNNPNASAYIAFDNNTIFITMESDADSNKSSWLIYSDPSFSKLRESKLRASFSDDL